jgi:two-component system, chemotaxis family, chemotaxis protein CheY
MPANVLIVDDSATMRAMIRRTLGMCGLDLGTVFEAANGIEALAQMASAHVDVVLLDINMPVMNGVQLVHRIRYDARLREIPLVIASTEGSATRIGELMAAGARGYLRKPFRPEQLRDVLAPLIGAGVAASLPSADGATAGDDPSAF